MTSGRSLLAHVTVGQGDPVHVTGGGGGGVSVVHVTTSLLGPALTPSLEGGG